LSCCCCPVHALPEPWSARVIAGHLVLAAVDRSRQNHVRDVVIQGPEIRLHQRLSFQTYAPTTRRWSRAYNGVSITAKLPGDNVPWFVSLLVSWLPFIALIGV
jgi:hypothetical protein